MRLPSSLTSCGSQRARGAGGALYATSNDKSAYSNSSINRLVQLMAYQTDYRGLAPSPAIGGPLAVR